MSAILKANWNYPTSIRFGVGRIAELPDALKAAGIVKPLLVTDPGVGEQALQAARVGPGVLGTPHAAALTDVHHLRDAGVVKRLDEARGVELIHADGGDPGHALIVPWPAAPTWSDAVGKG